MTLLMDAAAVFALDLVSETKMPCYFVTFDYYTRIRLVSVGPVAFTAFIFIVCVVYACLTDGKPAKPQQRRRRQRNQLGTHLPMTRLSAGLWKAAPIALFFLDLVHPMVCPSKYNTFVHWTRCIAHCSPIIRQVALCLTSSRVGTSVPPGGGSRPTTPCGATMRSSPKPRPNSGT